MIESNMDDERQQLELEMANEFEPLEMEADIVMNELTPEENNMGNMDAEQAGDFFNIVRDGLGLTNLGFRVTPTAPSICLGDKILLCEKDLNYPWFTKQMILHEISHYLVRDDRTHGTRFHSKYAELVIQFLAKSQDVCPELEKRVKDIIADARTTAYADAKAGFLAFRIGNMDFEKAILSTCQGTGKRTGGAEILGDGSCLGEDNPILDDLLSRQPKLDDKLREDIKRLVMPLSKMRAISMTKDMNADRELVANNIANELTDQIIAIIKGECDE